VDEFRRAGDDDDDATDSGSKTADIQRTGLSSSRDEAI
jgi:hypothetical protein